MTDPDLTSAPTQAEDDSLPDVYTSEAILYGKNYRRIKNIEWMWSAFESALDEEAYALESRIRDRKFVVNILRRGPTKVFAKSPQFNVPEQIYDAGFARDILLAKEARNFVRRFRFQAEVRARDASARAHADEIADRPVPPSSWKAAVAPFTMQPITYEYVHGRQEIDEAEDFDWAEAMNDLMGESIYKKMLNNFFRENGIEPEEDEEEEQEDEEEQEPEEEIPEPEDESYWDSLNEAIDSVLFSEAEEAIAVYNGDTGILKEIEDGIAGLPIGTEDLLRLMISYAEEARWQQLLTA